MPDVFIIWFHNHKDTFLMSYFKVRIKTGRNKNNYLVNVLQKLHCKKKKKRVKFQSL